jgi:hypothetical protein
MRTAKAKAKKSKPIDPRLQRIYGLIDDLWRSDFAVQLPLQRMFEAVDMSDLEPEKIKRLFAVLFESNEPDYPDADERREALSNIADDEHRLICACCRSHKTTRAHKATRAA